MGRLNCWNCQLRDVVMVQFGILPYIFNFKERKDGHDRKEFLGSVTIELINEEI